MLFPSSYLFFQANERRSPNTTKELMYLKEMDLKLA